MNKKDKNPNVPNLRFREFDGEWEADEIENVISISCTKYNPIKESTNYPCIELDSLDQNSGILLNTYNSNDQNSIKNKFKKGDVLYGKLRPYLKKYHFSNFDGVCSSEIWVMTSKKVIQKWIYYFIQTDYFSNLTNISSGSKMPRADWNYIKNEVIYYPKISSETLKICRLLDIVEEKIQTQIKIIELYNSLIKEIEDKLFWKNNTLHKESIRNFLIERNEKSIVQNQFPILSSTKQGLFLQSEYFNKETSRTNNIGYKITHKGDIIISPQNLWMGNITYNDKFENGLVSPSYHIYKINDRYNPIFISSLLKTYRSLFMYKTISEQGASIVRRNLNIDSFNELCFPIPNRKKQDEISLIISKLNQKVEIEINSLYKLKIQKKYLLSNMFI